VTCSGTEADDQDRAVARADRGRPDVMAGRPGIMGTRIGEAIGADRIGDQQ
jgi:hypothetical protein